MTAVTALLGRFRPTVRLRLTLIYGGLFLLTGAVLLSVNYGLVRRNLEARGQRIAIAPEKELAGSDVIFDALLPPAGARVYSADKAEIQAALEEIEAEFRNDALDTLVVQSSVALGVVAVASIGLGWLVAGRALRPLAQVTAAARRLSENNLHERLALEGPPDELKELADTFDAMLARLEAAFASQRRFAANASHELRTPLAIQRTVVDVALADPDSSPEDLRAMGVAVRDAVDRSEQLIDGLLVLARSEQAVSDAEACDLGKAATQALDQADAEAAERDLRIDARLDPAPTTGNRVLLERLVANLIQNAVRHNHDGGWLRVETGYDVELHRAWVRVRNGGDAIPADAVDGLFEPFRRAVPDRTGSARGMGLGLSIVRAVTITHGGRVRAVAPPEGGLDVAVSLPA